MLMEEISKNTMLEGPRCLYYDEGILHLLHFNH